MSSHFIERQRYGRGFRYFYRGRPLKDAQTIQRIKKLRIPPAWSEVQISPHAHSRIQATGKDSAGRLQYVYHPDFRRKQDQEKYARVLRFASALPRMRRTTAKHLRRHKLDRERVLAAVVRLMDIAYFRVGNEQYARENQSYGLTTIRSKHVSVKGDTITFDYVGKSGQKQVKTITDRRLARIVRKLDELPGYEVFKYFDHDGQLRDVRSEDVNAYIKEVMGEEFTAKDFRTWGGTLLASAALAEVEAELHSERERKKAVTACVKRVAAKLGNTPAVARSSYIDPRLIHAFMDGRHRKQLERTIRSVRGKAYMSRDEQCVLKILESSK